jgi:VanZ family protein
MLPLRFPRAWFFAGLLIMALVLVATLSPSGSTTTVSFLSDKAAHFFAFMMLMLWFCGVFRLPFTPLVALGLLAFGVLIELLQSRLPYRSAEVADALYDVGGIAAGWLLAVLGASRWTRVVEDWLPPGPRSP